MKKIFYLITLFVVLTAAAWILRFQIFHCLGSCLIHEDEIQKSDVILVLGGDALSRAAKAADLYKQGLSKKLICTGETVPVNLRALNIVMTESELTRKYLITCGVDSTAIEEFKKCASTRDEGYFFLDYIKKNRIQSAIIVTGKFHTGRVNRVFRKIFEHENFHIMITGAPSTEFSEDHWWQSEDGMIALNNEYMKSIYYIVKY